LGGNESTLEEKGGGGGIPLPPAGQEKDNLACGKKKEGKEMDVFLQREDILIWEEDVDKGGEKRKGFPWVISQSNPHHL